MLLRFNSATGKGYLFQVNSHDARIYHVGSTSVQQLALVELTNSGSTPRWYKASVQGTDLEFCYSDDGVTYTQLAIYSDARLSSGSVAYSAGWASGDETLNYVDDVTIEYLSAGSITVSSPSQYQTFQRDGSDQADIAVNGTYSGLPASIEYQLDGGGWNVLVDSPSGGSFSGTIQDVSAGEHTLAVRFSDATGVTDSVANVRVGDVFGWIGQSNQDGRMTNGQSYTGTAASVYDEDGAWKNLQSNYQAPGAGGFSVLPLLASLIETETGVPVAFVSQTQGGTGLVAPNADWSQGGAQYSAFITTVANSGVNNLKAFLWYQGERDIVNGTAETTYQLAEAAMLEDLQADTGFTTTPLIAANVALYTAQDDASINAIRAAKITNWDTHADIYPGPVGHDQNFGDGLHWKTDAEAQILANRWWRAISAALYGGSEPARGPQFSSATYSGSQITVTFTGGHGALQNQTDTTGWSVTDGNGSRTLQSATGTGDTVTLAVDQDLVEPITVSFASGNDAIGASLRDSGTYPLPPEPFVNNSVSKPDQEEPTGQTDTSSTSSVLSSASAPVCTAAAPSAAPTIIAASPQGPTSVLLMFSPAGDPVDRYAVEYGTEPGHYSFAADNIGGKSTGSYEVKALKPETTYYFRVRGGNGCATGPWSAEIAATTMSLLPTSRLETTITDIETRPAGEKPAQEEPEAKEEGESPRYYDLTVQVVDQEGGAVAGAKVVLSSTPREAVTDAEGMVSFTDVEEGEHTLAFAYQGASGEQKIVLSGEETNIKLTVELKLTHPLTSPTVVIAGGMLLLIIAGLAGWVFKLKQFSP